MPAGRSSPKRKIGRSLLGCPIQEQPARTQPSTLLFPLHLSKNTNPSPEGDDPGTDEPARLRGPIPSAYPRKRRRQNRVLAVAPCELDLGSPAFLVNTGRKLFSFRAAPLDAGLFPESVPCPDHRVGQGARISASTVGAVSRSRRRRPAAYRPTPRLCQPALPLGQRASHCVRHSLGFRLRGISRLGGRSHLPHSRHSGRPSRSVTVPETSSVSGPSSPPRAGRRNVIERPAPSRSRFRPRAA